MDKIRKLARKLLFPHIAIALLLIPVAAAALVYGMAVLGSRSPVSIAAYGLSAYTLTIWCIRVPDVVRWIRRFRANNRWVWRWMEDLSFQVNVSLLAGCLWNLAYCLFQLCLGLYHRTFWYGSLGAYYFFLGIMRLTLVLYTRTHLPGKDKRAEWKRYRACGGVLLMMNLALTVGILGALVMGAGMSLIMTDLGENLGIPSVMVPGLILGIVGMVGVIAAYPLYQRITEKERARIAPQILKLTEELSQNG